MMTWKTGSAEEFLEDIMTEHVCKWARGDDGFYPFICSECNRRMTKSEALTRLNATERLSAEDATFAHAIIAEHTSMGVNHIVCKRLFSYTNILEGKDD